MLFNKKWVFIAGLFGFTGVALGAFGAHIISNKIPENLYEAYKSGVLYHLVHTGIIAVIGFSNNSNFNIPALLFSGGIVLFSFSLYLYALTGNTAFAIITPFGGVSFLAGWVVLIWKAVSGK
jgi:uncharacterized membrane protein YgdD (TMEM256/DUF423 family)